MSPADDEKREFGPVPIQTVGLPDPQLPAQAIMIWPWSKKSCRRRFVLREGEPEFVIETGDEVEFCAPEGKEVFICFSNQDFFGISKATIPKGSCIILTVNDATNRLAYKYWVADSTEGFKCVRPWVTEEQGDPSGGGEMGGGS